MITLTCLGCRNPYSFHAYYDFRVHISVRWLSLKSTNEKLNKKRFSDTVNLPKFLLSMKQADVNKKELEIQKKHKFSELYTWQSLQNRQRTFTLHDGPPYANGDPHVGHALNKILKDITNRYYLLQGYKVNYIPGWDCHGMPIEQKAFAGSHDDQKNMDPMVIRQLAKNFAKGAIKNQRLAFERWGVMADWKKQCYFTFDRSFQAEQIEVFFKMFERGLAYQNYMPVFWSPSSRTALAEAELEYHGNHLSTAVYVRLPLVKVGSSLQQLLSLEDVGKLYALIWTTTPWTLPANKAICFSNSLNYCVVKSEKSGDLYIMVSDAVEHLSQLLSDNFCVLHKFAGSALNGMTYRHPLTEQESPLLPALHVTSDKGTGLVHTAPAHGIEDFHVAMKHQLSVDCIVDENGCYTNAVVPGFLAGKSVLEDANISVINAMGNNVLLQQQFEHSYPYDWRTKKPVILRASRQWFVDTAKIKNKALDCMKTVSIYPPSSESGMLSQLNQRTYWCISRQRVWGVPIPVFYEKSSGQALISRTSIDHIKSLFMKHGADCWWQLKLSELLPDSVIQQSGFNRSATFEKGSDILDIWFDSGSTWASVLKDIPDKKADLYLEGLDQFGGWFQSSLLTSVSVRDTAPYRNLVVHGFVVDESGRKMSKSLGNVVDPNTIVSGGKDSITKPAFGADTLRWWVSQAGLGPIVHIGFNSLKSCQEQIFKVRNTMRYLLGNLHDFSTSENLMAYNQLQPQDQYMLHLLYAFSKQAIEAYESYNYSRVIQSLLQFIGGPLSSLYLNIIKDRLYCNRRTDPLRRSSQTVQYHLLEGLLFTIAPILPHLAEEIYNVYNLKSDVDSIFKLTRPEIVDAWNNLAIDKSFNVVQAVRECLHSLITTGFPLQYHCLINTQSPVIYSALKLLQEEKTSSTSPLVEVLRCASVSLTQQSHLTSSDALYHAAGSWISSEERPDEAQEFSVTIFKSEREICERCRRYTSHKYGEPCPRCLDVMAHDWTGRGLNNQ